MPNDERTKMLKDLLTRVGSDGRSLSTFEYDKNMNNGGWGTNEDANNELHKLLGQQYLFDFSKPSRLIAKVKHIFFIAETKGTMESLELRPIEQAKISCAKKLFNEMSTSNVVYHDVDSYQSLLNIMNSL